MFARIRPYLIIALSAIVGTLILWLPYIFTGSFQTVYRHWDGPLYIIPAKSLYEVAKMQAPDGVGFALSIPISTGYFAAHLPLYPLLIRTTAFAVGYLKGMLLWSVFFGAAYSCLFYYVVKRYHVTRHPLILSLISGFFTPRFFVLRSVGAPETLFVFLILLSVTLIMEKKYLWGSVVASLATLTKLPGVLLFAAYGLYFTEEFFRHKKKFHTAWLSITLIPVVVLGLFLFYQYRFGDFLKYFHTDAVVPQSFPFSVFNSSLKWVETAWLEDIYFIFAFYLLALLTMWEKKELRVMFYFMLVFFVSIITVQHRDIARYSVPMLPFALVAFEKFFTAKKVLVTLLILLPALYLYAWNFMNFNVMPIADWSPFL